MRKLHSLKTLLRKLRHPEHSRQAFRYVIRDWQNISDIDLACAVCNSEFFKKELRPLQIDFDTIKGLLILAPHQDDETLGCGGMMILAAACKIPIKWLFITNGALDVENFSQMIATREHEAEIAAAFVNADIQYLGIDNYKLDITEHHLEKLASIVDTYRDYTICTPWLLDNPAKHRLVNYLLYLSNKHFGLPNSNILQYQVHNMIIANLFVDITSVIDQKKEMMASYKSQIDLLQHYDHINTGLTAWNSHYIKSLKKPSHIELYSGIDMRELTRLVENFYLQDLNKTFRGQRETLKAISNLESYKQDCH